MVGAVARRRAHARPDLAPFIAKKSQGFEPPGPRDDTFRKHNRRLLVINPVVRNLIAICALGEAMSPSNLATQMTDDPLHEEIATYNSKLPELIGTSLGKYVLVKGPEIIGVYDTYADALKIGYERFKLQPFMVKQVAPAERVLFFTRELGLECQQSTST
jgi:hypothetical protein